MWGWTDKWRRGGVLVRLAPILCSLVLASACGRVGFDLLPMGGPADDAGAREDRGDPDAGMHARVVGDAGSAVSDGGQSPAAWPLDLGETDVCVEGLCASAIERCPDDADKSGPGVCGCGVADDADADGDGTPDCVDRCAGLPDRLEDGSCGCAAAALDRDDDGVQDCQDACPDHGDKQLPGVCGCSESEVDSDADGMPACADGCPTDANKRVAGDCGCGVSEVDADADGTADCDDGCPGDANKTAPLVCGCGVGEDDTDRDGTLDCEDGCPDDPNTLAPGPCGCGVAETDTDNDGTPDCNEFCSSDPDKIALGQCGCGVADTDTDNDGTADCNDLCAGDPDKIAVGQCGCGVADTDTDNDGTADCNDLCLGDPGKIAVGLCGCGVADTDTDSDGTVDCNDPCPSDPDKTALGQCGCGVADTDTDSDGTVDCNDPCPSDPDKIAVGVCGCGVADTDTDNDGTQDCNDLCPSDPDKVAIGQCGCGVADSDADADGTADCNDGCDDDPDVTGSCPRKRITVAASFVDATLSSFPVHVQITGDAGLMNARADGLDLFFSSDGGPSDLDFEIAHWDRGAGDLAAWVRLPSVSSSSDTVFFLRYADGSPMDRSDAGGVWSGNYEAVYHFDGSGSGAGAVTDSSSSGYHGDLMGNAVLDGAGSMVLDGTSGTYADLPDALMAGPPASLTVEAWITWQGGGEWQRVFDFSTSGIVEVVEMSPNGDSNRPTLQYNSDTGPDVDYRAEGGSTNVGNVQHLVGVYDGSVTTNGMRLYVDGTLRDTVSWSRKLVDFTRPIVLNWLGRSHFSSGDAHFNGSMHEIRVSHVVRPPAWVRAEYENLKAGSSFLSIVDQP